jgi:hypothetical protein
MSCMMKYTIFFGCFWLFCTRYCVGFVFYFVLLFVEYDENRLCLFLRCFLFFQLIRCIGMIDVVNWYVFWIIMIFLFMLVDI